MSRTADPRRREAILEAARQTFERDGFADARMADIARRAKMAVGTLYLYFDSKDAIARSLASVSFARAGAVMIAILQKPLTRARVALLVKRVFDTVFENPGLGRFGIPLADAAPTLAPEAYAAVVSQLAWALDRQMEIGCVRRYDAVTLADYVTILLRRAVLQSANDGRKREPYLSTVTEVLAAALLPSES
ncbi:MAG: TetR/AcrR family transcriptional regulator [bacterium]